ncbi:MAG: hypothetical protein H8E44_13665 [Planctomycetes bacterium]|nr:hypothetical protein [Planctomycetota bacterium]
MIEFDIEGPFEIPFAQERGGRICHWKEFWQQQDVIDAGIEKAKGVYVFAWRAGKGYKPWYVGSATKTFGQEALSDRNRRIYLEVMAQYQKGTPVLFFVIHPTQRGPTNKKTISEIEEFLIGYSARANPDLKNVQGNRASKWSINGLLRSSKGKPTSAATKFKQCVGAGRI